MVALSGRPRLVPSSGGKVYLVGAGPGDPDLLTLRAHELLRAADLILYDNLVSSEVLEHARPAAQRRYVGKKRAEHACTQGEINAIMVAAARDGKLVVRLKGGDPYVFGRGAEEAQGLVRAGIPFEVVPGVTSALGAAAYAGMPLTHRDHTQAVTFVTGHDVDQIDWPALAGRQTLVVFMGLLSMSQIAQRLVAGGLSPDTPAAAVRWVTRGDQRVVTASLSELPRAIRRTGLRPPALVVIGDIVALRERIDWFDQLPLRRQTVVVTRAASQAAPLAGRLRRLGARVIPLPTISFEAPSSWGPANRALARLSSYDWVIFTSVNGVERFLERLDASASDLRHLPKKIAAIGSATAARLRELHLKVALMPDQFVAEAMVEAFLEHDMQGSRILLPRAEEARGLLPERLAEMGASIDVVPVYRTVVPDASRALAERVWSLDSVPDWITVTSSSTARMLARLVPLEQLRRSRLASIGPVTSATAQELGLTVAVEASRYTAAGIVDALCDAVARMSRS